MQGTVENRSLSMKGRSLRQMAIAGLVLLSLGGAATYGWMRKTAVQPEAPAPTVAPEIRTVTALGRLEPQGEIVKLSAPLSNQGNRVDRLLVREGDRVRAGQVIAILDSYAERQAALKETEEQANLARARLEVTRAGAKQGEINAQRAEIERLNAQQQGNLAAQAATVERLQAQLQNAETELNRYQWLYQQGAISASERDRKQLTFATAQKSVKEAQATYARLGSTAQQELNRARATLEQIAEVRPVDIRAAEVEVNRAIAARDRARASLDEASVRSPQGGEILSVGTRAGEVVGSEGIVEIGETQQMQAIAEIYQSDIEKIQLGQRARITSNALPGELSGTVARIDSQVRRQTIVNTDPSANIDARVIEVHIDLDTASSQKAAKFTNLQIQAVIEQ